MAVSIQPSGTYSRSRGATGSVSSASPRSTPDPIEVNISRRVDPRYHALPGPTTPTRHSLSQAFHEKNGRSTESGGLTMSEVTVQRSVKSLVSRGIN